MKKTLLLSGLIALGVSLGLGGCAATPQAEKPKPPRTMDWDGFDAVESGGVWIGGQPSDAALDAFAAEGGELVVNLRTDEEMAFYPYYERSLAGRGLRYVRIPTSGSTLDADEALALRHALSGQSGNVLLHCASGGRATYLWAMHLVAEDEMSAEEAIAWAVERRDGSEWERGAEIVRGMEEVETD
jgi:uncharacterized protein (TIGR01244 family)